MRNEESTRRKFLKRAGVAAGTLTLTEAAHAAPSENKPRKKVVALPGKPIIPATILSPAVKFGDLLFVSGQTAHDPATQKLAPGTFPDNVRQSLENVKAVLDAAGSSLDNVLKCTVFLTDMGNFQAMNEVYHKYFNSDPPARSTIGVKDLPGGTPIEIECIAFAS